MSRASIGTRRIFIFSQACLTVVLLATAGGLLLSYRAMLSVDTGFHYRDVLSLNVTLRGPGVLAGQAFDAKLR